MTVQNVIDLAKRGKLRDLSIKDDHEALLGYLNLGMIELYKRFPIKTEEYVITLQDGVTMYSLPSNYMWITAAYGEVSEDSVELVNVLPINEEDNPDSINTISYNTLQIPNTVTGAYISIIYVSAPEYLTVDNLGGTIELPIQMIEALLKYMAYEAYGTIGVNGKIEGDGYYQMFEHSCERIRSQGMYNSDDVDMSSRRLKGFV